DACYFASEAKAILAARPELRTIDARGLAESITLGCVLENRTLFTRVRVLPAASMWIFEHGQAVAKKTSYFHPREWEEQTPLGAEAFYQETRDVFSRILPRYFGGRERVGMSLTGGLDTRMIMAWQRCPPQSLPCYTWGGTYRDCQDVIVAREVARACGQSAQVISMGRDFLSRFAHYANRAVWLSDGCVDVSAAADVYMNERARAIAPVRMTGLYGGRVLRRVRSFKPIAPRPGLFQPDLIPLFEQARQTYDGLFDGHPTSFGVFRQAPWHHHGNLSLEQTQVTIRSPFLDNEFVKTAFRVPDSLARSNNVSFRLINDGNPMLGRIPTDRGLGGRARPIEAVAHAVREVSFKAEYAYDYGMPQWVARVDHILSPLRLERRVLGRHKALHYRVWYRSELSEFVRDVLLDTISLSRPYVDRRMVERLVAGHLRGSENHTTELHKLLTLELLHRNFVDGAAVGCSSAPAEASRCRRLLRYCCSPSASSGCSFSIALASPRP